jgi:hypothetical protein
MFSGRGLTHYPYQNNGTCVFLRGWKFSLQDKKFLPRRLLGVLFILSVCFFPRDIVGKLRGKADNPH